MLLSVGHTGILACKMRLIRWSDILITSLVRGGSTEMTWRCRLNNPLSPINYTIEKLAYVFRWSCRLSICTFLLPLNLVCRQSMIFFLCASGNFISLLNEWVPLIACFPGSRHLPRSCHCLPSHGSREVQLGRAQSLLLLEATFIISRQALISCDYHAIMTAPPGQTTALPQY